MTQDTWDKPVFSRVKFWFLEHETTLVYRNPACRIQKIGYWCLQINLKIRKRFPKLNCKLQQQAHITRFTQEGPLTIVSTYNQKQTRFTLIHEARTNVKPTSSALIKLNYSNTQNMKKSARRKFPVFRPAAKDKWTLTEGITKHTQPIF